MHFFELYSLVRFLCQVVTFLRMLVCCLSLIFDQIFEVLAF